MSSARDEMLAAIRGALADVSPSERGAAPGALERGYRVSLDASREKLVARFAERVEDYRATVRRVDRDELSAAVAAACERRRARRIVVPADAPAEWRPDGVEVVEDAALSHEQLDRVDGVVTGCALGIAETGTIVLDAGASQGRRAITLLPDYHLCVVDEDQVVGGVPEALARLEESARAGRPITFVSGPSATSDIELERVEGVHGPRTLEVLLVSG